MPEIAGLVAHITVFTRQAPEEGHGQIQGKSGAQSHPLGLPAVQKQLQKLIREDNGQHRHRRQKNGDGHSRTASQPMEELVYISRKAVVPSVIHNHADVVWQIRLKVSIVIVQRLDRLHIEQIHT